MKTEQHPISVIVISLAALAAASVCALLFGATALSLADVFSSAEARMVLFELRLPRVLYAMLVGGALALVGAAYQTLFRNPLASPFTLGVSSGAALGASLSLMATTSVFGVASSAMLGALVSISLILLISRRMGSAAGDSLLLVGIVFSFFCSSILTMLQYLSDYSQLFRVTRWMMGGIPAVQLSDLTIGALLVLILFVWLARTYRDFDLMLFGDDVATVKGASVRQLYYVTFVLSSLVVGWIVAKCGVIGFVGIVVPAVARLLVGLRHRYVVPLSFELGALLVVLCDLLGRVARPPFEVPAGVFTAILGGPIFIALAVVGHRRR
jgi:iron complex transport system permease protein